MLNLVLGTFKAAEGWTFLPNSQIFIWEKDFPACPQAPTAVAGS